MPSSKAAGTKRLVYALEVMNASIGAKDPDAKCWQERGSMLGDAEARSTEVEEGQDGVTLGPIDEVSLLEKSALGG